MCTENDADAARGAGLLDGAAAHVVHAGVVVVFAGEDLAVRVIAEGWQGRVADHDGLEVEAAVSEVDERIGVHARGRAAEDLAGRQRFGARNEHGVSAVQLRFARLQRGHELDGADQGNAAARRNVESGARDACE